jgi:hypothetical protein
VNPHREATVPLQATPPAISHRDLRLLRAVAAGRVECSSGAHPDFYVDGIPCCDHLSARALTCAGLIRTATGPDGIRVPVRLTAAGAAALGTRPVQAEPVH